MSDGKRYRYYVATGDGATTSRIPAHEIETAVNQTLFALFTDSGKLIDKLGLELMDPGRLKTMLQTALKLSGTCAL